MNGDKKYHITLGIMIFLFIIIIAGALAVGLGVIELNFPKSGESDNVLQESTNIKQNAEDNKDKEIVGNEAKQMTVEEKKALIIPYINGETVKKECGLGDGCVLEFNVNLPKINLNTETVKNINLKLKDIYIQANEQFKNPNSLPISYDIKYNANYVEKIDCIYISVENSMQNTHGSGGMKSTNIIYIVDKDKEISLESFLESNNITEDKIKQKIRGSEQFINTGFEEENLGNIIEEGYSNVLIKEITNDKISLQVFFAFELIDISFNY